MSAFLLAAGAFVAMEGVSYATHRWVMHGVGMPWHRSHHAPPRGRFERNDLFPIFFAALGIILFALGSGLVPALWWIGVGVTAYGLAYAIVHEVFIHRRVPLPMPRLAYFVWLRDAHRDHHLGGDEPFGMLLPVVRRPGRAVPPAVDPLDRAPSTPASRARL
jgi:beta-carotene 3-hydroxylase